MRSPLPVQAVVFYRHLHLKKGRCQGLTQLAGGVEELTAGRSAGLLIHEVLAVREHPRTYTPVIRQVMTLI